MSDKAIPHPSHQSLSPTRGKLDLIHDKVKKGPAYQKEGRTEKQKKKKVKQTEGKRNERQEIFSLCDINQSINDPQ